MIFYGILFRLHTLERPYVCKTCQKTFNQSSALKTHTRTHTQEKPYSCQHCSKKFTFLDGKKKHESKCTDTSTTSEDEDDWYEIEVENELL